ADSPDAKEDRPSTPLKVEQAPDSKNAAANTQVSAPLSTPKQRSGQQSKPTQAPERTFPPEGLFDGLNKKISLPIFSSKVGDKEYLSSVDLVDLNGEWTITPALMLAPIPNVELRLEPVANAKRWKVAAGENFDHIVEVDL